MQATPHMQASLQAWIEILIGCVEEMEMSAKRHRLSL
jgi:hypothetical protein